MNNSRENLLSRYFVAQFMLSAEETHKPMELFPDSDPLLAFAVLK